MINVEIIEKGLIFGEVKKVKKCWGMVLIILWKVMIVGFLFFFWWLMWSFFWDVCILCLERSEMKVLWLLKIFVLVFWIFIDVRLISGCFFIFVVFWLKCVCNVLWDRIVLNVWYCINSWLLLIGVFLRDFFCEIFWGFDNL